MMNLNNQVLEEFIKEKFKVSSHKIPFYIKWINLYTNFIKHTEAIEKNPDSFIVSLQAQYPEWQVKQAEKAVTIYLSFIKDVDFQNNILTIRSGKGDKDRQTLLSQKTSFTLKEQIQKIREYYEDDRFNSYPGVELPKALERKYPNAGKEWGWFWVFPSAKLSVDPRSGIVRRHHLYQSSLQKFPQP